MAFNPALAQGLRELLHDPPAMTERKMFSTLGSTLMTGLGPRQHAAVLARSVSQE